MVFVASRLVNFPVLAEEAPMVVPSIVPLLISTELNVPPSNAVAFIVPFTSNFSVGELVPMPTFIFGSPITHTLLIVACALYPILIVLLKLLVVGPALYPIATLLLPTVLFKSAEVPIATF